MQEAPNVTDRKHRREVKRLIKALRHKDRSVRSSAAEALGECGDVSAIAPLRAYAYLNQSTLDFRPAIRSIGSIGGPAAVDALLDLLDHPSGEVPALWQASVARALGVTGSERAIGPLRAWADRSDSGAFADAATAAIGKIGGSAGLQTLLSILADPPAAQSGRWQGTAAMALGALGDQRAIGPLKTWAYHERAGEYPRVTVNNVAEIGGPAAVEALLELLANPPRTSTREAWQTSTAIALGKLKDQRAIGPLTAAARQATPGEHRQAAMHGIGLIGGPAATDALLEFVDQPAFRDDAVLGLGSTGDTRVVPRLLQLLADGSVSIAPAAKALGRLGDPQAAAPLRERLLAMLGPGGRASAEDELVVAEALGRLGDTSATPTLCDMLHRVDGRLSSYGDQSEFVRIVNCLGLMGDRNAYSALRRYPSHIPTKQHFERAERSDWDSAVEAVAAQKQRGEALQRALKNLSQRGMG